MDVHLIDGTYELFRHFYGAPPDVGAVTGVLTSILGMIDAGATHIGVATDKVIESFRNELYPGYKTSAGMDPVLLAQFPVLEEALALMGIKTWPMVRYEADDALASAAARAAQDPRVRQVFICTPDKDLAQCVTGTRVVQFDRMRRIVRNEDGVWEKWGIQPRSMPDYLAAVGDSADGFPGLPGWGAKATSAVLARHLHFEAIPKDWRTWPAGLRGAQRLAGVLFEQWDNALLYRTLATLVTDVPVFESLDELAWRGPLPEFQRRYPALYERAARLNRGTAAS